MTTDYDMVMRTVRTLFEEAYLYTHRPTRLHHLYDDSIVWNVTEAYRKFWVKTGWSMDSLFSPALPGKSELPKGARFVWSFSNDVRRFWVHTVLHWRPAWVVRNIVDTSFRLFNSVATGEGSIRMRSIPNIIQEMDEHGLSMFRAALSATFVDSLDPKQADSLVDAMLAGKKVPWMWPGSYAKNLLYHYVPEYDEFSVAGRLWLRLGMLFLSWGTCGGTGVLRLSSLCVCSSSIMNTFVSSRP